MDVVVATGKRPSANGVTAVAMSAAKIQKAPQYKTARKNAGPSLLAADSEEEPSSDEASDMEDNRPSLLPLNEVIRCVPSSLSSLLDVMVPRLQQRSGLKGVSLDDQQSFVSILVGELSSQFSDLRNQIDDPFLAPQENKALHRLVAVQVCRVLEDLYGQYTAKAARLSDDGSLSLAAHMSRLRAQLAVQANKSINLAVIRRQVLGQLRGPLPTRGGSRRPPVPHWTPPSTHSEKTNLNSLHLGAPLPLSGKAAFSLSTGGSAVMRRKRVQKLAAAMGPQNGATGSSDHSRDDISDAVEQSGTIPSSMEPTSKQLTRAPSMPELYGNFLLCDWKLLTRSPYHIGLPSSQQCREDRHRALRTGRRASIGSSTGYDEIKWTSEPPKVKTKLGDYTREDLNSDLLRLSEVEPAFVHTVAQDDIHPLLQASEHGLSEKQRNRLVAHDEEMRRKREEEERRKKEEERTRREADADALPTLKDMENMQYFRSRAAQSLSHSNASLHMRSNASDWQSTSQPLSSRQHLLDLHSSTANFSMGGGGVMIKVDQWSEGEGAPSLSGSLLSSAGGGGVSGLSLCQSGPVERQSPHLPTDYGELRHSSLHSRHSSLRSRHSSLQCGSSTGPLSHHGSKRSHLDMARSSQHGSVSSHKTASQHGSMSSHPSTSQCGSVSSWQDMKTTSRHGSVGSVLEHVSVSSQLEMAITPRLERASDGEDTASWNGSSSTLETTSQPNIASQHGGSAENDSDWEYARNMEAGYPSRPVSSVDTSLCGGSSSSTLIPSRHGSASSALFQRSASKTESPLQSSNASSRHGFPSSALFQRLASKTESPLQSSSASSRHGSASTTETGSRYGSATASKTDTTPYQYAYVDQSSASSHDESLSSSPSQQRYIDSASLHGSGRTMETGSPSTSANMINAVGSSTGIHSQDGSSGDILQSASAIRFSCGGSTSSVQTHSKHGSGNAVDTTSRHGSASTAGTTSRHGIDHNTPQNGSASIDHSTTAKHGSASKQETAPQLTSLCNMDAFSASVPGSNNIRTDSRMGYGSKTAAQNGTTSPNETANTIDIDSQKGSTSSIETASQHESVCEIEAGSQSKSASNMDHSQEGSTIHLGTASQPETVSRMDTCSQYSSGSHEYASSRGESASCTPSQHRSASPVDIASQHVSAVDFASQHGSRREVGTASQSTLASNMDKSVTNTPMSSRHGSARSEDASSQHGPASAVSIHSSSRERESALQSTAVSYMDASSHTVSASSLEILSQHESASNTPSHHAMNNGETPSHRGPKYSSLNEDSVSQRGAATGYLLPPDTPSSPASATSQKISHGSRVSSVTRASTPDLEQVRSFQALRRPETLLPQAALQETSNSTAMLATSQQLLTSGNTLPAAQSVLTAGASSRNMVMDETGEVVGSGVSLPGSQRMEGDGASMGGEDTSCGGGDSGTEWEGGAFGDGQSFSDIKSFAGTSFSDLGSQEGERETSEKEVESQGPQPQPAVITSIINHQVVRSSDMCVSERAPLTSLRLKPYKPIWNELTGELDRKTVDEMDSNLTEGQEMEILYHELMKTIQKNYLDMESEPTLIPALPESVNLSSVLASSSLPHRASARVANPDLRPVSTQEPPWGDKPKRDQWKTSNLYTGPDPNELMAPKGSTLTPAQARLRQQYQNWLKWWRSTISCDDYLKFVAQKETDYLHHLYHLYDSEGSESEGEEERERRERLVRLHSKLQAKNARREERYRKKMQYEQGMWNVNTVIMGGLGGDPHSSGSSSEEDLEDQLRELEQETEEPQESVQERFQGVWSRLHLSQQQSMDMAAKYSSQKYHKHIRKALPLWERACTVIEKREEKLKDLLAFEKSASNPSRLFGKGKDGSSDSRLKEAKRRKQIHLVLDELEQKLILILRKLQSRYGDIITYKGRPYNEKMQHDRTELLYLLQQERRRAHLPSPPPGPPNDNTTNCCL